MSETSKRVLASYARTTLTTERVVSALLLHVTVYGGADHHKDDCERSDGHRCPVCATGAFRQQASFFAGLADSTEKERGPIDGPIGCVRLGI